MPKAPKRLCTPDEFRRALPRRELVVDGAAFFVRDPTIAEAKAFERADVGDELDAAARIAAALVVDAAGEPLFESADQAAECLVLGQLEAIVGVLEGFADRQATTASAEKNSSATRRGGSSSASRRGSAKRRPSSRRR